MKNPIKSYLQKLLLELLEAPDIAPKFDKIKKFKIAKNNKPSVYTVINNFPITRYQFQVEYIDPNNLASETVDINTATLGEMKKELEKFSPKFDYFKNVYFSVNYTHTDLGDQRAHDFIVSGWGTDTFKSKDLNKICETLIKWMKSKPELLL